jgi:hypothetical protein
MDKNNLDTLQENTLHEKILDVQSSGNPKKDKIFLHVP